MEISIQQNASTIGIVRPEFISTTLDWWPLETRAWGNSSVIHADLTHPNLIAAAKGLSPMFIRVGGSQADSAIYNMSTSTTTVGEANRFAQACDKNPQLCLTMQRWEEVLKFAQDAGASIVFTLAYIRHTKDESGQNDQQDWDSTNARQLLQYTAHSKYDTTVFGFELGNEVTHKGKIENVTRLVNAYAELRHIIDETWPSTINDKHKPKILGPASTGQSITTKLLKALGSHVDIATYHKYHGGGKEEALVKYAKSTSIIQHPNKFHGISSTSNKYMDKPEVWVGEGAMAYNSGRQNITDSFVGSFWFTNLLGAISKSVPHTVYCRQALVGGYYELISHETMKARPDYWIAHLWKRLVGTKSIGPILSPSREDSPDKYTFGCCEGPGYDTLLIHAFCAKGERSNPIFVITNIDKEESSFNLNITVGTHVTKYILTGKNGRRDSRSVVLNGNQLLTIENGQLPEIVGEDTDDMRVTLPPVSIAFVTVHGFEVDECVPPIVTAATETSHINYTTSISLEDQHQYTTSDIHDHVPFIASESAMYYSATFDEVQLLSLVQILGAMVFFAFILCLRKRLRLRQS
eukprot:scaffold7350_cov176-Skeletonema_marinoi.AAC.1